MGWLIGYPREVPDDMLADFFDCELDLGLVAYDPTPAVAAQNTARLSAALQAQWSGGSFPFARASRSPILRGIRADAKEFFFQGPIVRGNRIGGLLVGSGGRSYPLPETHWGYAGAPGGGAVTRFTRIDGENGGEVLRVGGHGFVCGGIQFSGRRYISDGTGEGPQTGTKTPVGILIEGRAVPASGGHVFRDCMVMECGAGILAKAGYYNDAGAFVADENHADNGVVSGCNFWTCSSCFRSENVQAVNWSFENIRVGGFGGAGLIDTVVVDAVRGGNVWLDGVDCTHSRVTLFKVSALAPNDYSPYTSEFVCRNFKWDRMVDPTAYLTLFNLAGVDPVYNGTDLSWFKWKVRCEGHIANSPTSPEYDATKLIQLHDAAGSVGVDRSDLLFDVKNLPTGGFTLLGAGPWRYPNATWRL